jgi:uncharacterized protein
MDYPGLIRNNIAGIFYRYADLFFQSRIFKVMAMFILGYLLARNGRYKTLLADRKFLWKVAIAGLLLGLPSNFMLAYNSNEGAYYGLKIEGFYQTIFYALGVAPLALAYVSLFFLLALTRAGKFVVKLISPMGKMAFTNYIMQSLAAILLLMPFGIGILKMGALYNTIFALSFFMVQIIISHIWLSYFQYGPVEWLWRTATYGKRQSFKKSKVREPLVEVISRRELSDV